MFGAAPKAAAQSGVEIMLRSMGLAPALDAMKLMIEQGALEKILKFSEDLERLQKSIDQINEGLVALKREKDNVGRIELDIEPRSGPRLLNRDAGYHFGNSVSSGTD